MPSIKTKVGSHKASGPRSQLVLRGSLRVSSVTTADTNGSGYTYYLGLGTWKEENIL